MSIEYIHTAEVHTLAGPAEALPILFAEQKPNSLLDVGCGTGTWLKAAIDFGIPEVLGLEGIEISPDKLQVPAEKIRRVDLTRPWNLNEHFDAVICLEVAEHLDNTFAASLIDALIQHGDRIYFSAACPGQPGQHHVNCQWPAYWQHLFNERGYVCEDAVRWQIWDDSRIEPWYRQNLFLARRALDTAGLERRIRSVVHPDIWNRVIEELPPTFEDYIRQIEQGRMSAVWNLTLPARALWAKFKRKLK